MPNLFGDADPARSALLALLGTMLIFFVVSPAAGWMMTRQIKHRATALAIIAVMLLSGIALFAGSDHLLGNDLTKPDTHVPSITLIALVIGLMGSIGTGALLVWFVAPVRSALDDEMRYLDTTHEDPLPFANKRKKRLEKRSKRR